jgi:hypothetical protein
LVPFFYTPGRAGGLPCLTKCHFPVDVTDFRLLVLFRVLLVCRWQALLLKEEHMRRIILACLVIIAASPVQAECIDDIRQVFRLKGDIANMRVRGETIIGGNLVQETNGWVKDFGNVMFEVIGRNWWSMSRDGTQYNSSDGKSWTQSAERDVDWEAKARASSEDILANMTQTACKGTEDIDGKTYEVYQYRYATQVPVPSDTVNTIYFDRDSNMIFRTIAEFKENGGGKLINTYERDASIELPDPDG